MNTQEKITTGLNDRPRNETIAQSGAGLPDDTSAPIEVSDAEIERVREKLGLGAPDETPASEGATDEGAT